MCNSYSEISRGSRHTYATLALLSSVPSKVTFEVLDHKVTQTARASNSPRTRGDVGNRAIFEVLAKCLSSYEFRRRIVRAYEGFLGLPPSIILSAMWLAGVALMGVSTLALYLF